MNAAGLREKALLAVVGVVVLYAIAAALWFLSAQSAWEKAMRNYRRAKATYQAECELIAERQRWTDAYESEKAAMPTFEAGKATDTTWLQKMDDMATKNRVQISQRQAGQEIEVGEVLELPIEVRSWEGSLEALVKFMYELENTDSGMFDIGQLNFKPSSKKGYLRGSFTLKCAYMREQ